MKKPVVRALTGLVGVIGLATALWVVGGGAPRLGNFGRPGAPTAPTLPRPRFSDPVCEKVYRNFYADARIDLRVVFGYKDTRPARFVADRYERALFSQGLTEPCQNDEVLCGFHRPAEDPELFTRTLVGPDGAEHRIELRVLDSSAGPDDQENRQDPFQKWKSARARKVFLEGLHEAHAVFYSGHSRASGGPDFEPPRLNRKNHVAYDWYRIRRPGLREMREALGRDSRGAPSRLRLLGLYSCASDQAFADELLQRSDILGLISTEQLIYFSDALEDLKQSLSGLLKMKCQPDFRRAGIQVFGFF